MTISREAGLNNRVTALAAAMFLVLGQAQAIADSYPIKPISWIMPSLPGGVADQGARMIAKVFSEKIGQPVIVDNKPGAGGIVAAESVASARPDGYTLLYGTNGSLAAFKFLYPKLPYDPLTSFSLIHGLGSSPLVLVVPQNSPFKTVDDVLKYAKENPEKLNYGAVGSGGAAHLATELMARGTGAQLTRVSYKGSIPAITDLVAGRIDLMFDYSVVVKPLIESGKLRALAQTGSSRMTSHPDVPTFVELGHPDVQFSGWAALVGPAGMPQPVIDKIARAFSDALKDPNVVAYQNERGAVILSDMGPAKLREFVTSEQAKLKDIIEKTGATPD